MDGANFVKKNYLKSSRDANARMAPRLPKEPADDLPGPSGPQAIPESDRLIPGSEPKGPTAVGGAFHFEARSDYQERLSELGIRGMRFNKNATIGRRWLIEPPVFAGGTWNPQTPISIGAFTLVNGGRVAAAKIGRYCSIAGDVAIGSSEHPLDRISTTTLTFDTDFHGWAQYYDSARREEFKNKTVPFRDGRRETTIGHDVWIGLGAFIRAGVTIGTGAIIGAGAVVVSDIPPYAIALGVPAKVKRLRFPEKIADRLLKSQWWDYALYDLLGQEILDGNKFCDLLEQRKALHGLVPYRPRVLTSENIRDCIAK